MIAETFRVLLVEDEPIAAKVTEHMLRKRGGGRFTVTLRGDLASTVEALGAQDFDIILSDLNLPDSAGLDTLARIAGVAPDTPVVVLTASNDDEIGIRAMHLGAQDFLVKGDFNEASLQRSIVLSVERHRLRQTIRRLAVVDELTGLYNRRGFNSLQGELHARGMATAADGFVCFFDLDRFKQVNDVHGHKAGDEALVEFGNALRNVFRKDALLARFGGDEFVALGLEPRKGHVEETLRALENLLVARNARDGAKFRLESSAGCVGFGRDLPGTIDELLSAADNALYENKQRRRRLRALEGDAEWRASA